MKETYKGWTAEQYSMVYLNRAGFPDATVDSLDELRRAENPNPYREITPWAKKAFDAAREAGLLDPVAFPQPELKALVPNTYYFYNRLGLVFKGTWDNASFDRELLKGGHVYRTREAAEQRVAWDAQQIKRHVAPQWFRDLGPEFLFKLSSGDWVKKNSGDFVYFNSLNPEDFKPLPKDVVHVLNGKEYRWPALVGSGTRYYIEGGAINAGHHFGDGEGHRDYKDAITELEYCFALRIAELRK